MPRSPKVQPLRTRSFPPHRRAFKRARQPYHTQMPTVPGQRSAVDRTRKRKPWCRHCQKQQSHLGSENPLFQFVFNYGADKRKITKDVLLCYDDAARGDLAVRFVCLKSGERFVVLFQEPDAPFETGFVREQIPVEEFATRFVNGRTLMDLIQGMALD